MKLTWDLDTETMGVVALVVGDVFSTLAGVNPSVFTIRTFRGVTSHAEMTAQDIHIGMVFGSAVALAVALGGTLVTRSWWPFAVGVGAVALADGIYEWALRNPHNLHSTMADQ
jgi:hypothetical protein